MPGPRPDDSEITLVTKLPVNLLDRVPAAKVGTVTVLVGAKQGASFLLSSQAALIGRNPRAHVPIEDEGISRSHARIVQRGGRYEIEDMDSTNGTFVDGTQVKGSIPLEEGARIQIGHTLLRFSLQDQIEWEASRRVYEASVRDGLTGAFNRRYFEERLVSEFAYAARHGTALCVVLVDVDHFKQINDRYGHQAGDQVLRRIGSALRATLRAEDVLARYGGEEFAVLARGIDANGVRVLAERLRSVVERTQIDVEQEVIRVTASIGLAHNHAGAAASDPQRLVAAADSALYAAKHAGRNRVEQARSPGQYSVVKPEDAELAPDDKGRGWDNKTSPQEDKTAVDKLLDPTSRPGKKPDRS